LGACSPAPQDAAPSAPAPAQPAPPSAEVRAFLDRYDQQYQRLLTAASEAEWASNTHIVEGDDTNARRTRAANEALAAYTGSVENIETARRHLAQAGGLTPLQRRQLKTILFKAGANPQTVPELVKERIAAETAQTETLYGFRFLLDGKEITPNDIDAALRTETDLARRQRVWEASKAVGPALREGLVHLRRLRNDTVRALDYPDFFAYMASEYDMSTAELAGKIEQINRELRPLYRELHTYMRHELAQRYGQPVPALLPAHWLPNRWGQEWAGLSEVADYDLAGALRDKTPQWLLEQAERFYVSLGFEPLPASFWEKSSLYPLPAGATYKKNTHASAWHMDRDRDVRSLMSVEPNPWWYTTTHHELGHIYYYLSYSTPDVPIVLRTGANRAYHEAIGSLIGLAANQPRFVAAIGLPAGGAKPDPIRLLLKEALYFVVFVPWSTGTMFHFEKELYADELPPERWNARWWELAARYQGIAPPAPRDERWCDPATKTHINDDPAGYYDYALAFVLLFQLHDHIARQILKEDPRDTNYFGRRDVGAFLGSILRPGATVDWRTLMQDTLGGDLSARAMVEYFAPLQAWLERENRGRTHTLEML
jgi:peptidyl-dipeptidase A